MDQGIKKMRNRVLRIAALLLWLFFTGNCLWGQADAVEQAESEGQESSLDITEVLIDGVSYISAIQLAKALNLGCYLTHTSKKLELIQGDNRLKLTLFSRIVVQEPGNISYNMELPVMYLNGSFYVPSTSFLPILNEFIDSKIYRDNETGAYYIEDSNENITGITIEEKVGGTLVILKTKKFFRYEHDLSETDWLHLMIYGARINPEKLMGYSPRGIVSHILAYQHQDFAQISFGLKSKPTCRIRQPEGLNEIQISLWKRTMSMDANSMEKINGDVVPHTKNNWAFDTIIIDPGHGGSDPGAVGSGYGTQEKDINLDIANRLKKRLEKDLGVKVVMTRETDKFVSLSERVRIAIENGGKMFISLHANSAVRGKKTARGTETYFLSLAKTDKAREVARRENAALTREEILANPGLFDKDGTLKQEIIIDMASKAFLKESQQLAALVQQETTRRTKFKDRGVDQAGFFVMLNTQALMPSILFEAGFLSNSAEEKRLKRISTQQHMADGLFQAIKIFKEQNEKDLSSIWNSQ